MKIVRNTEKGRDEEYYNLIPFEEIQKPSKRGKVEALPDRMKGEGEIFKFSGGKRRGGNCSPVRSRRDESRSSEEKEGRGEDIFLERSKGEKDGPRLG